MARPRAVQLSGTKGVKLKQVRKKLVDLVLDSTSDFLVSFVAVAAEREGKNFVGASSLGSKQIKALPRRTLGLNFPKAWESPPRFGCNSYYLA